METNQKNSFLLLVFLLASCSPLFAQISISGTVSSAKSHVFLDEVSILIKGTYIGTVTDAEGHYSLSTNLPPPITLVYSYVGFSKLEVVVEESTSELDVSLRELVMQSNEIVVTAQLREQILQEVPVSVAVIDESFIEHSAELDDPGDLIQYVPGFAGKNYSSTGSWYTIRGINTNSFGLVAGSKVAVFHDGAYNGRTSTAGRGFFDVERVELLKGPQSSLFGRNATAGVINVYSNKPKFYKDIELELNGGNWGQIGANLMVNYPFSDKLTVRYAGKWQEQDGILEITNQDNYQVGKKDILANRVSLFWRPLSTLNFTLRMEHQRIEGGGIPLKSTNTAYGAPRDRYQREIELDTKPFDNNSFKTASLQINWVLNNYIALNSITAINDNNQEFLADLDGLPANILRANNPNSFSNIIQEIRLNGKTEKLDWLIAGSIFSEEGSFDLELITDDAFTIPTFLDPMYENYCIENTNCSDNASEISRQNIKSASLAFYGNLNYAITDRFKATIGLRYTNDSKDFTTAMALGTGAFYMLGGSNIQGPIGQFSGKQNWDGVQPRVVFDYKIMQDLLAYISYNRGYLAGGFNNFDGSTFPKETNNAYEIGMKSTLVGGLLKLNLAGYYINYKNLQVQFVQPGLIEIQNAGKVQSKGLEIESSLNLRNGLDFIANFGLNDSKYKEYLAFDPNFPGTRFDFSGKTPDRSPKAQLSLIGQYTKEIRSLGNFFVRLDYAYQSKEYYTRDNDDAHAQEGYGLFNAMIGIEGLFRHKLNLSLYASNLADKDFIVDAINSLEGGIVINPGAPRFFGLKAKFYNFLRRGRKR